MALVRAKVRVTIRLSFVFAVGTYFLIGPCAQTNKEGLFYEGFCAGEDNEDAKEWYEGD